MSTKENDIIFEAQREAREMDLAEHQSNHKFNLNQACDYCYEAREANSD